MRKLFVLFFVAMLLIAGISSPAAASNTPANEPPPPVPPYALKVNVIAKPVADVSYSWTIAKSADQSNLTLSDGQLFPVNYQVTVAAPTQNSAYSVWGYIRVINPDPVNTAYLASVVNEIYKGTVKESSSSATCPKMVLLPGEWMDCTYAADLPDMSYRISAGIATVTAESLVTSGWDYFGIDFNGTLAVKTITDECIDVTDTNVGVLGTVCAGDTFPKVFSYVKTFGKNAAADVVLVCGPNSHPNIASFVTNDTQKSGSANLTVNATVACGGGCSLTPGYWKTHSSYGPAPYDSTWAGLENQTFYLSGKTWYTVLWTPPAGNPYYILAHAYIATHLNVLNGASTPASVASGLTEAETFFSTYIPGTAWTKAQKSSMTSLAGLLDSYNNGLIGPGHCSE